MGPSVVFDKSAIQALSIDESLWFDQFYQAIIVPEFFIETISDLSKEYSDGRTPEIEVRSIARKTPELSSCVNIYHSILAENELNGIKVEMSYRPIVPYGRPIQTQTGVEVHFDVSPEAEAFSRWQEEQFEDLERVIARNWRSNLLGLDLEYLQHVVRIALGNPIAKSHEDALRIVDEYISIPGNSCNICRLIEVFFGPINCLHESWYGFFENRRSVSFREVFPYNGHLVRVYLLFFVCSLNGIESIERRSNIVDIAYLFYLPFASIFTSGDRLHERMCAVLMDERQVFIRASALKADLRLINDYYSQIPPEMKELGIHKFAQKPPLSDELITYQMWDKFLPGWRVGSNRVYTKEEFDKMIEEAESPSSGKSPQDPEAIQIQRKIRRTKGNWKIIPDNVR